MKFSTRLNFKIFQFVTFLLIQSARLLGKDVSRVRAKRNGLNWELDLNQVIDLMIFITGKFDSVSLKSLQEKIQYDDIIIDVGANIGSLSLSLANHSIAVNHIYAFEPSERVFDRLQNNINLNPKISQRLTAIQGFVTYSEEAELKPVYSSWKVLNNKASEDKRHLEHMGLLESSGGAKSICLDEFVKTQKLERVDWLKIDVDGFEANVLLGAEVILREWKPSVFIELSDYHSVGESDYVISVLSILFRHGYHFYSLSGEYLGQNVNAIRALIPTKGAANLFAYFKNISQ